MQKELKDLHLYPLISKYKQKIETALISVITTNYLSI